MSTPWPLHLGCWLFRCAICPLTPPSPAYVFLRFGANALFSVFPDAGLYEDIDYRQCGIHPAERCVHCFTQHKTQGSSRGTSNHHMEAEGRRPSPKLSACRSAVVKDSRRRRLQPHYETEDDACRVILAASREVFDKPNEFPFFHAEARQPKVSHFRK